MLLSDLKKGDCADIVSINSDIVLKNRFNSFGIRRGATIYVIEYTISKNTIEIQVYNTKIALRLCEAEKIEVEPRTCEIECKQ